MDLPGDRELKRGSTQMLVLALLEGGPRHGYEIGKRIREDSGGVLRFHMASLYPALYQLERRGWIKGTWGQNERGQRRRYYQLTKAGERELEAQRGRWRAFVGAVGRLARIRYA